MSKKSTQEEIDKRQNAHDALIKHVFDNIRNLLMCSSLAFAGGAAFKLRSEVTINSTISGIIAAFVIFIAVGLLFWNMIHGIDKIIRPVKGTRKIWYYFPFMLLYVFSAIVVFEALLLLQSDKIRHDNVSNATLGQDKLKPDEKQSLKAL